MKHASHLIAALAIALAGGLPLSTSAQTPKKITFLTNYVYNGRHAPFFVGLEKGFYKEAGFDIEIKPATGSGFVITAIDGGKADYGMADVSSVVQGIAKGAKVKAFSVYTDITTNGLAALTPYPSPESIVGKKIAASQTDSMRVILPIIFDLKKLDASKLDWQAADPGVYFSLLLSGQVDLITASSDSDVPALAKIAAQQGKTVHFSSCAEWGYDIYGYVLVGGADALAKDPGEAKRFAEATRKAVDYSIKNPDETAQIMVKHNPTMNLDTVKTQWSGTIKSIQTPYVAKNGYGAATEDRIERSIALTKKALKLEADLKPADLYMTLK
ncbi:MAG: ABC transporter substrate-binding protein [Candidatus Accumulibacter sp.]|jgi:NitT/TauT family transport system substrate-binding protein|nr:ABC transporter substrate-binding protein [Accumulibacter sp.]